MRRPLALLLLFCLARGARAHVATPESTSTPDESAAPVSAAPDPIDEAEDESDSAEAESEAPQTPVLGPDIRYTTDLSDEELQSRWEQDLDSLGSISVGFADRGRMINAVQMPEGMGWVRQRPELAWGAQETIDALTITFRAVREKFPQSAPARLSQIGTREGGYLRPHRSHQSGRDADIGFFYRKDLTPHPGAPRERLIDPARNWALIRALVSLTDVQMILVDRGIQKVLRKHALAEGEDPAWVDRIIGGKTAIVQHAKHHRDHFHVRFFAPRSQELGRRVQPLLALRPEQNLVLHKVKPGQTLGRIARVYGTTISLIRAANKMRGSFLRLGQQLRIPLRRPCTQCPLPPPVVVPARCLPPAAAAAVRAPDVATMSVAGAPAGATQENP